MLMEEPVDLVTQETTTVSTIRSVFYFPLTLHACSGDSINTVRGEVTCHGRLIFGSWESLHGGNRSLIILSGSQTWRERRPFLSDCI